MKRLMIISTTVAFCGGLATMMAASSCDPECVEDRRTSVYLSLISMTRDHAWDPSKHPTQVSYAVHPSADGREDADFEGTFGMEPAFRPGRCLEAGSDCREYALGFDEPGTYEVAVDVCGKRFSTSVEVGLAEDMCHIEPQTASLELDASGCLSGDVPREFAPDTDDRIKECDRMAHPSVYVVVGNTVGDVFMPINVDEVWYTVRETVGVNEDAVSGERIGEEEREEECEDDDKLEKPDDDDDDDDDKPDDPEPELEKKKAVCVEDPSTGNCIAWLAGFEQTGWFNLGTEYCEVPLTETVFVGKEPRACHVSTEYVLFDVETRGCLATPSRQLDPNPDPVPGGPDELRNKADGDKNVDGPGSMTSKPNVDPDPDPGPEDMEMG